jgi:hypothetical protein
MQKTISRLASLGARLGKAVRNTLVRVFLVG